MNVFLVSSFSWVNKCFLFYSILFFSILSEKIFKGTPERWRTVSVRNLIPKPRPEDFPNRDRCYPLYFATGDGTARELSKTHISFSLQQLSGVHKILKFFLKFFEWLLYMLRMQQTAQKWTI